MPLTELQHEVLALLAPSRSPDSHLAGGAALHFTPNSARYSNDLDFFHDSVARVASAYAQDAELLAAAGFAVEVELSQPGFVRAIVRKGDAATRVDWAHESAWRFMPPVQDPLGGYLLHEVDLAVNKVLALAGRDEPRDFVDVLYIHEQILPLGALCWAAVGKDPGFTPQSLLELLKRRGRPRAEEIARLHLATPFDLVEAKGIWMRALEEAEEFVRTRPADELGCLYWDTAASRFIMPALDTDVASGGIVPHFGRPEGVLPQAV